MGYNLLMNMKNEVLAALYGGNYISGEKLASKLGVSRTAVWKAVSALRKEGLTIDSVTNRGYRLIHERNKILPYIIERETGIRVEHYSALPSTNELGKRKEKADLPVIITADKQTRGRARFNGKFPSDEEGIYMSLCLSCRIGTANFFAVTNVALRAVKSVFGGEIVENALFKGGKKKCGVLVEAECDSDFIEKLVVGIGVYTSPEEDKTSSIIKIVKSVISDISSLA